jgi:glycosyltransferase involved in cell wall biosynthesis
LRICYVGWGDYVHVRRFARWFSGRGHEVHVITHHPVAMPGVVMHDLRVGSGARSRADRYARLEFRSARALALRGLIRVRQLVREIEPDLVHAHSLYYPGYLGAFVSGVPRVITVWSNEDVSLPFARRPPALNRIFSSWALGRGDIVTGISRSLVDSITAMGGVSEKTFVFHWGVDLRVFNRDESVGRVRARLGLDGRRVVLSPRNIDQNCNIETVVKAIPLVARSCPDVRFLFLWNYRDESYMARVRRSVGELAVECWTSFRGPVDYSTLHYYYRAADVFVSVPHSDSGPVSLVEAMACGAAPVVSDLPCVREWIDDGLNGLVVKADDHVALGGAISRLLVDDDRRNRMAAVNEELVRERADAEQNMAWMEGVYERLTGGVSRRQPGSS